MSFYRSLNSKGQEIRVVSLASSDDSATSPVRLTMEYIELPESPSYFTLSYTWDAPFEGLPPEWDDPNATRTIYIDGQPLEVRWNLEAALKHLRDANVFLLPYWIDAICINQSDISEQNQQVQMMGEIYASALTTWVWLGPEWEDCYGAKKAITKSMAASEAHPERFANSTLTFDRANYGRMDLLDGPSHEEIRAFARLLNRSWFRRAWIVQEVALSKSVVLVWGDKSRDVSKWQWLNRTGFLLHQYLHSFEFVEGELDPSRQLVFDALLSLKKPWAYIQEIESLRLSIASGNPLDLTSVLDSIRRFHASQPKDKVYAALGMAIDSDIIKVDYNLGESDVFLTATRAILENTHNLQILENCCPSLKPGLPSWVPDFALNRPLLTLKTSLLIKGLESHELQKLYTAGTSQASSIRFEDGDTLVLRGIAIGKLSFVGHGRVREQFWKDSGGLAYANDWMEASWGTGRQQEGGTHGLEALQIGWFDEWLKQSSKQTPPSPSEYFWTQEANWTAFIRTICANYDWGGGNQMPKTLEKDFSFTNESVSTLMKRSLPETLASQIFAATMVHTFCLVREDAKVGDWVFVANGADSPYLLRPSETGNYRFVGCCYVHGFMAGEARNTWRTSNGVSVTLKEMEIKIK